jgi:nitroreductase
MENPALPLIKSRHSKRAFLDIPVDTAVLKEVLSAASHAASSKNTQPWEVTVVMGEKKDRLKAILLEKYDAKEFDEMDYQYSLDPEPESFKERARDCGYKLFDLKGIAQDDKAARDAHGRLNWTFFGAPVVLFFFLPKGAQRGNFLDMGLFLQNVMLGLTGAGLGSCPQVSLAAHSHTIRTHLKIPNTKWLVCGLSVGHPDPDALVNTYIPTRLNIDDYVTWITE